MSNDEIVRALRCYASDCDGDEACFQCTFAWMCDECDGNAPKIIADALESLQTQLAESQRREQAAVEDINSMLDNVDSVICCHYCAKSKHGEYCGFDSEGENGELVHCPGEWRGPMNAERQIRHE